MWIPTFLLLCQAPPPPQPEPRPEDLASVSGKVVNKLTREPVKHAEITLRTADYSAEVIKSGADGTFFVDQLRPGRYTLEARKNGFTAPRRKPGTPPEFVVLEKGLKKTGHTIELLPQAAISGKVMDENGEPVANAMIMVEPVRAMPTGMIRPVQTNDKGEYRLFGLEPGRFRVRVTPSPPMMLEQTNRNTKPARVKAETITAAEGMVPVYFPSATSADQAAVIELAAGDERQGVDIQMVKARVFEVSGKVIPPPGWTPDNPSRPMLGSVYVISTRKMQFNMGGNALIDNTGRFVLKNIAPGSYYVMANLSGARTPGHVKIDVLGGDLTNVEIPFHMPVPLTGTVKMPEKMDPAKLRLILNSADGMGASMAQATVDAKGNFKLDNVTPDTMTLRVMGLEPTAFIQGVRLDGQDVEPDAIPVKPGEGGQMELTISSNGGSVEGTLRTVDDKEHEGAAVVLWPSVDANAPIRPSLVRVGRSGTKGRFELQGVRPGKYLIAAFDNLLIVGPTGAPDEEILRGARSKAVSITIEAASKITQDLKSLGEPE